MNPVVLSPSPMTRIALTVGILLGAAASARAAAPQTIDFRNDWRFSKGDAAGAEQSGFDDSSWAVVRVPHDWAIAGPFDPSAPSGASAKLPWKGVAWYRKSFDF